MEHDTEFLCPWCGQANPLRLDLGTSSQRLVTDCEVCCRPMEINVECADGEILSLDVGTG